MRSRAPDEAEVRAELERVLSSPGFASAGRLPQFLRFIVQAALDGVRDRLKESVLGVEVFEREAGYDPCADPVVDVEARRLRSRLDEYYDGPGKNDPVRIRLPTGGYAPVFANLEESASPDGTAALTPMPRGGRLVFIITLLALAGIILGWWQTLSMRKLRQAPVATVAVIPFENAGGDPGNDYLSRGLSEDILNCLQRTPGMKVIGRSVMARYGSKAPPLDEVAAALRASMVVEGSVWLQGQRLRVVARLVSVKDGSTLWSRTYERRMADVFAVEEEIARSIAAALRVPPQAGAAARRAPAGLEAYSLYLRGRQQANLQSADGMRRAIAYFEGALRLEPDYAKALEALSMAYTLAGYYSLLPQSEVWRKSRDAARKAIALDAGLGEAHASLGFSLAWLDWNWSAAEAAFRKAIELNEPSAMAHSLYVLAVLLPDQRMEEARREFARALELDPLLPFINSGYALYLLVGGKAQEAVKQYERVPELDGLFDFRGDYGMALSFAGRRSEACESYRLARPKSPGRGPGLRGMEAVFCKDLEAAHKDASLAADAAAAGQGDPMDAARLYAMLGEKDHAIDWLAKAVGAREAQAGWIKADPRLKALRQDPRLDGLIRRVGLHPEP